MNKKTIWFDARKLDNKEKILSLVFCLRFEFIIINYDDFKLIKPPHKVKLIIEVNQGCDIGEIPKDVIFLSDDSDFLMYLKENGFKTSFFITIKNQEDMESAWQIGKQFDYVLVELLDPTNIPLELIIARLQNRKTVLLKVVSSFQDALISFGVMESGSDGVVIKTENIDEIIEFDRYISKSEINQLELVKAKVTEVTHIGMGYRACIDTTNILQKNEGMIIGSTSNGGLLVSSETHYLPYMELRPFRVNAGAVHSYVWAPDGMTNYLTELKAGSVVLCVNTSGKTREVTVGRVKIEMRPLLKIEAEFNGILINTIVQDDWHIRIFGGNGEPRNASTIAAGDEMLAYLCQGGRHVGVKIDENFEEK